MRDPTIKKTEQIALDLRDNRKVYVCMYGVSPSLGCLE